MMHLTDRTRRLLGMVLTAAAAFVMVCLLFFFVAFDRILNRYAKEPIERAFAEAYPGYTLRIGALHFNLFSNTTACLNIAFTAADSSIRAECAALVVSGIGWHQILWHSGVTAEVVRHSDLAAEDLLLRLPGSGSEFRCGHLRISVPDSSVDISSVTMAFPGSHYRLRCARLQLSSADSSCQAEHIELRPDMSDEEFFAASPFMRTRYSLTLRRCTLRHLPLMNMTSGSTIRIGLLELHDPELGLLVDHDKQSDPNAPLPKMPGDALAELGHPVRLDSLVIVNGTLRYGERLKVGEAPGVIAFDSVAMTVTGIGNGRRDTARIRAHGRFMHGAVMSVAMNVPLAPRQVAVSYTGALTAMDVTALNAYLETAQHVRINSGTLHEARFDVRVARGQSSGHVVLDYDNLSVALLDKETGSANTLKQRMATALAAIIKIRGSNRPGSQKVGQVKRARESDDSFMNIAWLALRSGIGDVVGF